jgi:hypothetical protein
VPDGLEDPEPIKAKFTALIESAVRDSGFALVPAQECAELWEHMTKQVGGYFDAVTGKLDKAKFIAVREHCLREFSTQFHADAWLHPVIRMVPAPFTADTARWHGTSEPLTSAGFWQAFLGVSHSGTAPAFSLLIAIEDVHGVDMYLNAGGIQLANKIVGGKFTPVPRQELFVNDERNAAAVHIALGPLRKSSLPAPSR